MLQGLMNLCLCATQSFFITPAQNYPADVGSLISIVLILMRLTWMHLKLKTRT